MSATSGRSATALGPNAGDIFHSATPLGRIWPTWCGRALFMDKFGEVGTTILGRNRPNLSNSAKILWIPRQFGRMRTRFVDPGFLGTTQSWILRHKLCRDQPFPGQFRADEHGLISTDFGRTLPKPGQMRPGFGRSSACLKTRAWFWRQWTCGPGICGAGAMSDRHSTRPENALGGTSIGHPGSRAFWVAPGPPQVWSTRVA